MEDRIKSDEAKHEKELEKLRCELSRLQQQSKNSFLQEFENQQQSLMIENHIKQKRQQNQNNALGQAMPLSKDKLRQLKLELS